MQLVGNGDNIPLVAPAMAKLNVSVVFPGNNQPLLKWAKLHIPPSGTLGLYNPIECGILISLRYLCPSSFALCPSLTLSAPPLVLSL